MKKIYLLFFTICFTFISSGQITVIGHNMINYTPLKNVSITVKENGVITKTLNTQSKSEFKLLLDFGKLYTIYVQHPKSPVMYFEVLANTVPADKYEFRMGHEFNIPFYYKTDEDVDTSVFKNPFYRIVFNGNRKMVDDTAYNGAFSRKVIKQSAKEQGETQYPAMEVNEISSVTAAYKQPKKDSIAAPAKTLEGPAIIAGKIYLNGNKQLPIKNKAISILNKKGEVIKSTYTNRFGAFSFSGIPIIDVAVIKLEVKEAGDNVLSLLSSRNTPVLNSKSLNGTCEWQLSTENLNKLVDNNFTTNIGGKLVSSTPKEKKFYAKQEVFLCNKYNTVIKKTTTNLFGTFVFEDIKPDAHYFIAISKAKLIPGERVDLLSKEDNFLGSLDSMVAGKQAIKITSNYNKVFNDLSIGEDEMKMDVKATIYGDNVNTPIGKLKVVLLNDNYEVIDSTVTDDFGSFKFKYLPFLKRFYLSAENTDNILDVFKNIIIYSNDDNLIKIMTHQKGSKFSYKPVNAEVSSIRDLELDDPWLEFVDSKPAPSQKRSITEPAKSIVENILFETGKYDITPQSKEILDKVVLVLHTNKKLHLEIGAHTDSKGSDVSNLKLSQMRAKTVQDYIARTGIDIKRIASKGYGESKLINACKDNQPCSEIEHAQNRRIEFKILGE